MNYTYTVYTDNFYFGTFKSLESAKNAVTQCRRGLKAWQFNQAADGSLVGTSKFSNEIIKIVKK